MEDFKKNNNTERGRRGSFGERKSYGSHGSGERRSYGERKNYGERKTYGERRTDGEGRSNYGERRSYGERKNYGERKPYGERRTDGENRNFGERKSYGDRKPYGERKNYGERKPYGERRGYGDRSQGGGRPFGRKPFAKKKEQLSGIDRMVNRKPLISNITEKVEAVPTVIKEEMRLNKFIANSGVCSRREADVMIQAGVVSVNGEVVTELGTKVNVYKDEIRFNGELLRGEEKVYIVMNKPKGFVTTTSDAHAEKTVMDLLKNCPNRVFPVGRLDKNTTGVLMFTNDGEIAERLTHPSYDKKKIYQVTLDRNLEEEDFKKILEGVSLTDGLVQADELEYVDADNHRKLGIEIHSGKNRIVRRIFESLGYDVKGLDRVYFAGLTKKGLKRGEWRFLTENESNILKMGAYI